MPMKQGFKFTPTLLNVDKKQGKAKKKTKVTLVFDAEQRRQFLTGFRKRRLQRLQKAREELEAQCKEEKKRIKREAKENLKKLISHRDIPELEDLVSQTENKYEVQGKTVSILELDINKLRQGDNWIGENKPVYEDDAESNENGESDGEESDTVPGMELEMQPSSTQENTDGCNLTKKELLRKVQKETLAKMKNSRLFQRKQKFQRGKNIKLAKREKMRKERSSKLVKGRKTNKKFTRNKE